MDHWPVMRDERVGREATHMNVEDLGTFVGAWGSEEQST